MSFASVVGRSRNEVERSLRNYALSVGGGLERNDSLSVGESNFCSIYEADGNTTVFNPIDWDWEVMSAFISRELESAVFCLHIHDSDLWMYMLYVNGEQVDQFNTIPDYWDEDEELDSWKGDAGMVAKYAGGADISKYLIHWDENTRSEDKTYPDDEHGQEGEQLFDVMRRLKLPNPLDDEGQPKGQTFIFWTDKVPLVTSQLRKQYGKAEEKKAWWKFW